MGYSKKKNAKKGKHGKMGKQPQQPQPAFTRPDPSTSAAETLLKLQEHESQSEDESHKPDFSSPEDSMASPQTLRSSPPPQYESTIVYPPPGYCPAPPGLSRPQMPTPQMTTPQMPPRPMPTVAQKRTGCDHPTAVKGRSPSSCRELAIAAIGKVRPDSVMKLRGALHFQDAWKVYSASLRATHSRDILERILINLDMEDLLFYQGVCKNWKSCIANSRPLQQKLFFVPADFGPIETHVIWQGSGDDFGHFMVRFCNQQPPTSDARRTPVCFRCKKAYIGQQNLALPGDICRCWNGFVSKVFPPANLVINPLVSFLHPGTLKGDINAIHHSSSAVFWHKTHATYPVCRRLLDFHTGAIVTVTSVFPTNLRASHNDTRFPFAALAASHALHASILPEERDRQINAHKKRAVEAVTRKPGERPPRSAGLGRPLRPHGIYPNVLSPHAPEEFLLPDDPAAGPLEPVSLTPTIPLFATTFPDPGELSPAWRRPEASWRRMFLTQPPLTRVSGISMPCASYRLVDWADPGGVRWEALASSHVLERLHVEREQDGVGGKSTRRDLRGRRMAWWIVPAQ